MIYSVEKTAFKPWFPVETFQELNYHTDLKFGNPIIWKFPRFSLNQKGVMELLRDKTCAVDSFCDSSLYFFSFNAMEACTFCFVNSICLQLLFLFCFSS